VTTIPTADVLHQLRALPDDACEIVAALYAGGPKDCEALAARITGPGSAPSYARLFDALAALGPHAVYDQSACGFRLTADAVALLDEAQREVSAR
jgi:hypothetical protein